MKVKIRNERGKHLAYFIDSRRIVGVNEVGAIILDLLFNQEKEVQEIVDSVTKEYQVSEAQVREDAINFLKQIDEEIHPDGFNVIEQEQLIVPLGVELEVTTSCNLSCKHCFQDDHVGMSMPTKRAIEIINILANNQVCEISLMGGEPCKHEGLLDILECCQEQNMAINLVTNGTLIDDAMIDSLAQVNRLVVIVSLDGTEKVHDQIRGDGIFKQVENTLKRLRAKNVGVEVTCTLSSVNLSIYKDVVEYCESIEVPCNFNLFKPFKSEHQDIIPDPNTFFEVVADLLRLRRDKGYKIGLSNAAIVTELLGLPSRNECRATRSGMVVDVNERMLTCPSLVAAGYYGNEEIPLFNEDFAKTWINHKTFSSFRENGLRECQARSYIFNHDVKGHDPYGITAFSDYWNNK